ncbi:MAG: peptidase M48 [Calditrichaeota bacterium]|nr:MAG: peptidase M48 [Calditrichota bacterium]
MSQRVKWGLILLSLFFSSCARDYVTGKRTFSLVSESREIEIGREADPQIIAEFGLYDDPKLAAYIDSLGQAIARVSHRPNLKYTFRVVDSPIVNAFALPGGWVYFTRGILAHFNSEAELAGVMGHEVGHVVARHGAEQMSKAQLAGLALNVGAAVSANFRRLSRVAEMGLGLLFLKFSRGQESEADLLGVEYSTRLGYNAHQMANFFKTIARISEKSGQSIPSFLSTHPNPRDREVRIHQLTDEWQKKIAFHPNHRRKIDYLRRIDGIVYGNDPRQGFVENGMFYHPQFRFQFPVVRGWQVNNSPSAVQMVNKDQTAGIQFTLGKGRSPREAADNFLSNVQAEVIEKKSLSIHGMPAMRVEAILTSQNQNMQVLSHFILKDGQIFVFHGFTSQKSFDKYVDTFNRVARGFDRLRNRAALSKKPLRVRIRRVRKAGNLATVLKRMGAKPRQLDELAILNGLDLKDPVPRGAWIKILHE